MALRRTTLALLLLLARPAVSAPVGGWLSVGEGMGWASRAGAFRGDATLRLGLVVQVHQRLAIRFTLDESLERLTPAGRVGLLVRPWTRLPVSPYVSVDAGSLAGPAIITPTVQAGIGVWWRLGRWIGVFAEADCAVWLGHAVEVHPMLSLGVAATSPTFWW